MKIRTKLLLALSTLPILVFLLIGISWFQLSNINKMNDTFQSNYELSYLAGKIHREVKNEAISIRNIAIYKDKESIDKEINLLQQETEAVTQDIALIETKVKTIKQSEMVEDLIKTNQEFNAYKAKVIKLISEGKSEEAISLISSNSSTIQEKFLQDITDITDAFENNMNTSFQNFSRDFQKQIILGSLISLVGIIIVSSIVFRIVWTITTRLNNVSGVMDKVANGSADLSTKVEVKSDDEIDHVAISFNKMVESLEAQTNKEQSLTWIKSNIADITTSLSGMNDLESLAQTFMTKVVPLMDACQAVFYVKDGDENGNNPIYRLLASYAFKERKHVTNTFASGEGLIGQAVLEKTPIILTDVPSDYIRVKSGLGESPPLTIYVLPVSFEGDVKAVLELASFKPFSSTQQTFIEEMISGLGIILESMMGKIRLANLLEETQALMEEIQAQSEELQSQQEELRVTNEELEEQTQALRQSEERLQVQQEELEQTNTELKEKADHLEEQNKRFEITNREVERARAELEEKAKQLALSSKYKSEFLANMSHELRTPLNSLLILSKLLSDNHSGNLTDKQVEYSKTIYSSGNDLLALINEILDLAKIESGKMDVNPSEVRIADLAEFVDLSFRPVANEKNLSFTITLKENLPLSINSDEQRLQQVLKNLLSNAFKFTNEGEVNLEVDVVSKNNQPTFSFSIIDTGVGIPKDKQELIFQAFQQADGTTSRKFGGTGLGLSISREIATLLGGEIVVKSVEGKGSTFTLFVGDYKGKDIIKEKIISFEEVAVSKEILNIKHEHTDPISTQHKSRRLSSSEADNDIKKLLIVDDDITQRNSLMEFIGDMNVIIKAVSSGTEAVEELKVGQFDCIVLDLGLADTSGFDLLEKIKTNVENENIKVFIYTGRDLTSKEEMYLNKYAHTIIIKDSHSPQRLKDELELYLKSNFDKETVNHKGELDQVKSDAGLEGKKILLVDDDVRNVYALSSILELYGMKITFAENGLEGLELLEKNADYDLVLMDIMMPEMDGYEAIRRLRDIPKFVHLPVIALTAKAMKEDQEKCMEAGASDYIVKPVNPDQLISLIRVWLYPKEEKA
ncbi:response regulator [Metabacillus bambusae]|uniref:histidine kinase n=1 Tax=Metabacillus bambusae TaxID=2795218 RepID=A0ABS3MW42_9BACI|nr:response regulator [Metabacillus bambusae]MBO1510241.1 response regulator [Metabacillus bambusae]